MRLVVCLLCVEIGAVNLLHKAWAVVCDTAQALIFNRNQS